MSHLPTVIASLMRGIVLENSFLEIKNVAFNFPLNTSSEQMEEVKTRCWYFTILLRSESLIILLSDSYWVIVRLRWVAFGKASEICTKKYEVFWKLPLGISSETFLTVLQIWLANKSAWGSSKSRHSVLISQGWAADSKFLLRVNTNSEFESKLPVWKGVS